MVWWNTYFLGARIYYWLYLLLAILMAVFVFLYWQREYLRKKYYELRFPERIIIVNIIYPGNWIKRFYRLIPDKETFVFGGEEYLYNNSVILKNNTWFAYKNKDNSHLIVRIPNLKGEDKEYYLDEHLRLKMRWANYPEIWYKDGCPFPIDFQKSTDTYGLKINAEGLSKLHNSTTITQIYSSVVESRIMIIILIMGVITFILSVGIFSKLMGWLK